jgi:hypothetical protein
MDQPTDPFETGSAAQGLVENGLQIARALLGVPGDRLRSAVAILDREDLEALSFVLIGTEHQQITTSLSDVLGNADPAPLSLLRIAALEKRLDHVVELAGRMGESLQSIQEGLSPFDELPAQPVSGAPSTGPS